MVIDAHVHLWDRQHGRVNGRPVVALKGGRSDFGGALRQMMPPYMIDGANTVDMLMANMDYARVSGCVVTQEYIDGRQDEYLLKCRAEYPEDHLPIRGEAHTRRVGGAVRRHKDMRRATQ